MILSFTGTQQGMTAQQLYTLRQYLRGKDVQGVHHGCCKGADTQFHYLITEMFPSADIYRHWPIDNSKVTACNSQTNPLIDYAPKQYLDRNLDIVLGGDELLVAPLQKDEQLRSGTWATARLAYRRGVDVILILPSGSIDQGWEPEA